MCEFGNADAQIFFPIIVRGLLQLNVTFFNVSIKVRNSDIIR
jgi:hypothetical protein